ncbi:MAG: 50S ribosomal protein L5 [Planctomycetes bacterium]|nr:50S ribosomal protein L5 [Planctomycetota bacterium]
MANEKPRLKKLYDETVKSALVEKFELPNVMMVPVLKKITVNMGLGAYAKDKKALAEHINELAMITGQKPVERRAKRSAATFKLRTGDPCGVSVTLSGERMWHFLEKVINVACPRIRDFNGLKHGFDRQGNYSVGLQDQTVFPEIRVDRIGRTQGMDLCFTITGGSDDMSKELLLGLGFPLKREGESKK